MIFLSVMMISGYAFARLGENEDISKQRYGDPVKVEEMEEGSKMIYYTSGLYNISILFKNDKAVVINRQIKDKSRISLFRIEHLLHNNGDYSGPRNIWYLNGASEEKGEIYFIDRSGNTVATYYLGTNTLSIKAVK